MNTKELIMATFEQYENDIDVVFILQEKLNEWGNDLETFRDIYDIVFEQCSEQEKHFTMKNLFQYGDEVSIETAINTMIKMMVKHSC